jgi:hypothetical protein
MGPQLEMFLGYPGAILDPILEFGVSIVDKPKQPFLYPSLLSIFSFLGTAELVLISSNFN